MTSDLDAIKRLRGLIEEIDAELDRQLYEDDYVRGCRLSGLPIPKDCEHHVIITERLRQRISAALK